MNRDPHEPDFQLASYFPYLVRLFYRDVTLAVRDVYATRFGLSVIEWRTMAVLHDHEPLSAKEIVARSSMDKVNVSRAISSLQKTKLLERHTDPTDKRRALLRLTRRGKQIMRDLVPLVRDVETQLLFGLSPGEQATLKSLMEKVSRNAQSIVPPDSLSQKAQKGRA